MSQSPPAAPRDTGRVPGWLALLVGWYFLYLLWWVQPHLVYIARGPLCSLAPEFVGPYLRESGGPGRYLAQFLGQFDYYDWLGALRRVPEVLLLGGLVEVCLRRLVRRPRPVLYGLPMIVAMLLAGRYDQSLALGLVLLVTLATALAVTSAWVTRTRWRLAAQVLGAALVYWAVGGVYGRWGLVLIVGTFGVLTALLAGGQGWWPTCLAVPAAVALVGERWVLAGQAWARADWLPGVSPLTRGLSLALLLWPVAAAAGCAPAPRRPASTATPGGGTREERLRRLLAAVVGVWLVSLVATQVVGDPVGRYRAEMDWAVLHGRWERVLSLAGQHSDPLTCFDVNTALARRGELGERMCAWPQRPDGLLLPMDAPYEFRVRVRLADQYLALGRVNSAERALWNTLPHTGDNPYLLRRLATCALVKGDRPAARLWLTVLGYDVIHGAWARDRLRRLASDPDSRGDAEVQSLRARLHRQDDLLRVSDVATGAEAISFYQNEMLRSTLDANPRNRLALDYLMALYLLIRRPDGVAQEIGRLAPGEPIPRLWEEGLLVAMDQPGARIDLRGHTISAAARQSYARFQALLAAQHGDARAAWPRLSRECAGSYFLYLAQARTGP